MQKLHDQKVVAASAGVDNAGVAGGEAMARAFRGMFEAMQTQAGMGKRASPATGESPPSGRAAGDRKSTKEALAEEMVSAQKTLSNGRKVWVDLLPERAKFAYGQYLAAAPNVPDQAQTASITTGRRPTTKALEMPAFETWQRYVRQARQHLGQQKNTPRAGRSRGRSIALPEEIEFPEVDEADEAD